MKTKIDAIKNYVRETKKEFPRSSNKPRFVSTDPKKLDQKSNFLGSRGWAKSLKNRRKHYKILKQNFIVLFSLIN